MILDPHAPGLSPAEARRVARRAWLLARLGHPERRLARVVTVAGTNGKGSTVAFLSAMLRAAGHRVASFTSPDLHGPFERFHLPEGPMAPEAYGAWLAFLAPHVAAAEAEFPEAGPMGAFERWALVAWLAFAEAQPDVVLAEAGVGGRGDAVDLFDRPVATLFTAVGADHLARLGGSIPAVVAHKAGLMRPGVPAIASTAGEGVAGLAQAAQALGAPFQAVTPWAVRPQARAGLGLAGPEGATWCAPSSPWGAEVPLGLAGHHQGANAALAAAALPHLASAGLSVGPEAALAGLASAAWPGRMEWAKDPVDGGWWLLDVAHNPPAAAALAESLGRAGVWCLAMQRDKDAPGLVAELHPAPLLVAPVPGLPPEASWSAEAVAEGAQAMPDLAALTQAARLCSPSAPRVALGSVYWVAAMREALGLAAPCDPAWREAKPGGEPTHGQ